MTDNERKIIEARYEFFTGCVISLVALIALAGAYRFMLLELEYRREKMHYEEKI